MSTRIFVALAGLLLFGQALAAQPTARERVIAAAAELDKHSDGFSLDRSPQALPALNNLWAAMQAWAVDYLGHHPDADPLVMQTDALVIDSIKSTTVERLAPDLYAINARDGEIGNIFLIARRGGRYAVVWDVRDSEKPYSQIGWRGEAAKPCVKCRAEYGEAHALPPDSAGHPRFYIDAGYAQGAGATVGAEISVWQWDGTTAHRLLNGSYAIMADDWEIHRDGDRMTINIKDNYRMLFACGACSGRKLIWTVKLTPDRVEDLGKRPDVPEMDTVDEVFFRLWHGKLAKDLAAPAVLKQMAAIVAARRADADPKYPTIGLLMGVSAEHRQGETTLDVGTDADTAAHMRFTAIPRKRGFYLTKLEILAGQ